MTAETDRLEDRVPEVLVRAMEPKVFGGTSSDGFSLLDRWRETVDLLLDEEFLDAPEVRASLVAERGGDAWLLDELARVEALQPLDVDMLIHTRIVLNEWEWLLLDHEKLLGHLLLVHRLHPASGATIESLDRLHDRHRQLHLDLVPPS